MSWLLQGGQFALGILVGLVVAIVCVLALPLVESRFLGDATIVGAILGGFMSGLIAVFAAIYSSMTALRLEARRSEAEEGRQKENQRSSTGAALLSAFSRMTEYLDLITKAYRHQLSGDARIFIYLQNGPRLRKPLSGLNSLGRFSEAEKVAALSAKDVRLFNDFNQADRYIESLYFLAAEYERAFRALEEKALASDNVQVAGRWIESKAVVRRTDIIHLQDVDEHLRRLLLVAYPEIRDGHRHLIDFLGEKFSHKINFKEDTEASGSVYSDDEPTLWSWRQGPRTSDQPA